MGRLAAVAPFLSCRHTLKQSTHSGAVEKRRRAGKNRKARATENKEKRKEGGWVHGKNVGKGMARKKGMPDQKT
jgi:hypothetical protein